MKSILKKVAGAAIAVTLALGMFGCSNGLNDDVPPALPPAPKKETVATPAFSVAAGEVTSGTIVTISCTTEGAKIYYTKDGSAPTASSTEYTAGISIGADVTIKAIAVKDGMNDSTVASASYTAVGYNWYESPVDAVTGNAATAGSTYIYFGVFPKTVLPEGSTVTVDEADSFTMGANTYYKGSDNNYYAKVKENCSAESSFGITYTDRTAVKELRENSYRYFKVEPIKWKVLTTDYNGKALLLAEDILTGNVPYCDCYRRTIGGSTVYVNNYKYSTIRAYLNGKYESDDTQEKTAYDGKGFLQTAFTATAQSKIAVTLVDNSADSTTDATGTLPKADGSATDDSGSHYPDYTCESTEDKIFLLSEKEVTTNAYGFAAYNISDNARIRFPTDYAKANYVFEDLSTIFDGFWFLRTPMYYDVKVYDVRTARSDDEGHPGTTYNGVVPALSLSL